MKVSVSWLKWPVVILLSVAAVPIINATMAGLATSGHPTGQRVYDATPDSIRDAEVLVAAYERHSLIKLGNNLNTILPYLNYAFKSCEPDWVNMKGIAYDDSEQAIWATVAATDRNKLAVTTGKVESLTTPFGRGFDAACLQTPGYRNICKLWIDPIMAKAGHEATPIIFEQDKQVYAAMDRLGCAYAAKVKAAGNAR